MANKEQLAILNQGVKAWNEWREKNAATLIDLSEADLCEANLVRANLSKVNIMSARLASARLSEANLRESWLKWAALTDADLHNSDLTGSRLDHANLQRANLENACLSAADLVSTDLSNSILCGSNLRKAYLYSAIFNRTNVKNADFFYAHLGGTLFIDIDLSGAKGLNEVNHDAPSHVSTDTIYRSGGNIPEKFLRGCGVPYGLIEISGSLVGKPTNFFSCFISHSAKDKRFCERLYADLQAKDVRVWYFPEDAKWGEPVWGEIDRNIKDYDKLVVVLSENSLQSGPVSREIDRALNREDSEHKNILFPITLDRYVFDTWEHERKADVLRKVIGDFGGWEYDTLKYEKAFDKLLKGLQA